MTKLETTSGRHGLAVLAERHIFQRWNLRPDPGALPAVPSVMAEHMASAVSRRRLSLLLAGVAIAVQVLLLYYFLVLGLGWGGFWYLANLGQAAALLVLALVLVWKRPLLVVLLPGISLLLYLTFQAVDPSLKTTGVHGKRTVGGRRVSTATRHACAPVPVRTNQRLHRPVQHHAHHRSGPGPLPADRRQRRMGDGGGR